MSDDNVHSDPHENMYSDEEAAAYRKEVADLNNLWNVFTDQIADGNIPTGIHPPPAFLTMYTNILETTETFEGIGDCLDGSNEHLIAFETMVWKVVAFADMMLRFGQWCVSQGMLHANAIQCKCGTVNDTELRKLLEGPSA